MCGQGLEELVKHKRLHIDFQRRDWVRDVERCQHLRVHHPKVAHYFPLRQHARLSAGEEGGIL